VGLWDGIKDAFSSAWEFIKDIVDRMGGVMGILMNPFGAAVKGATFLGNKLFGSDAPRPTLGAAGAAPAASSSKNESRIQVDFSNLPKGARVSQESKSSTPVDMSMGYSMVSP
jgi:hypothetical protein